MVAPPNSSPEFDVSELFESPADAETAEENSLERIRAQCLSAVRGATSRTVLGSADVTAYRDDVLSDRALLLSGISDYKGKLDALLEMRMKYIPSIITDAAHLERTFARMLKEAETAGGISSGDAQKWMDRLRDSNVIYWKKKQFINDKIARVYLPNWVKLGQDLKKIEEKRKELKLKPDALPELAKLNVPGFLDMHFLTKRDYANKAEGALAAFEKGEYKEADTTALYQQAKKQLDGAVADGSLAPWKVGEWLKRIFVKNARREKIKDFIEGRGETTLGRLIERWAAVRKKFDWIEMKRKTGGSPRGFHFVHINVFLGWHYEKRTAYVQEADHRFTNISNERDSFLKIRHALDTKDWEEADDLIAEAKSEDLSASDAGKLQSMEKFLREHRKGPIEPEKKEKPAPEEILLKMRALVNQVPDSLRSMYAETLRRGYNTFWTFSTLLYNRDWCYRHHYLDDEKEHCLYEESKDLTAERIQHGHSDHFEANDLTRGRNNQDPAVRDQGDMNAAQVLFCDSSSKDTVLSAIQRQGGDRQFWYWTSLVPRDVTIARHLEMTRPGGINAQLKKLMRQLAKTNVRFTLSGAPEYKQAVERPKKRRTASEGSTYGISA
ncbi:hypothetical protein HYZ99_03475 [Candidatus Peregrinibacteria bacterium]|nr:hypothetical protein [Candidatus Peregrinibacteria bacterium]